MLNLIKIQFGKHYGQVLFDHNAENIRKDSINSNEVAHRRKELKLRKWFFVIAFVVIVP